MHESESENDLKKERHFPEPKCSRANDANASMMVCKETVIDFSHNIAEATQRPVNTIRIVRSTQHTETTAKTRIRHI